MKPSALVNVLALITHENFRHGFPLAPLRQAARRLLGLAIIVTGLMGPLAFAAISSDPPSGWWRDAVFYEVFVRSFADAKQGSLAGDGIGDLQGLIEHLDYLNDGTDAAGKSLNVTALWLMPIQPSPSYHGYDVSDYFAVNPQYGNVVLLKQLIAEAHRRGLRVIIDLVLNHCSSQHPLFQRALSEGPPSEVRKMFRFADLPQQIAGTWDQRVWHPGAGVFYYGAFSAEMPDWNCEDAAVVEHHRRAARFWLQEVGVDGFRLDAVRYLVEQGDDLQDTPATEKWLKDFTAYCHAIKPGSLIVAENTAHMPVVAKSIRGAAVDSSFEFDLARATVESIRLRTPGILMNALRRADQLYGQKRGWSSFLSNHDQDRIRTQLEGSVRQSRFAAKLLFTMPGVPFIYYGEELGLQAGKPDPDLRTPMPWNGEAPNAGFTSSSARAWEPPNPEFPLVNVDTETRSTDSMLALYRQLIRLNLRVPTLRNGGNVPVESGHRSVYAVMRQTADDAVLILANFGAQLLTGVRLKAEKSAVGPEWKLQEELEQAHVDAPTLTPDGGFKEWAPLHELPPESLYVLHWRRSPKPASSTDRN